MSFMQKPLMKETLSLRDFWKRMKICHMALNIPSFSVFFSEKMDSDLEIRTNKQILLQCVVAAAAGPETLLCSPGTWKLPLVVPPHTYVQSVSSEAEPSWQLGLCIYRRLCVCVSQFN